MRIILVRHGESRANVGEVRYGSVPDHLIELTDRGHQQAKQAGATIGAEFIRSALLYRSPYVRARQTFDEILVGAGIGSDQRDSVKPYEDPRLREVDHGYEDVESQQELRRVHGWFYYRFKGGESPADCYDRVSGFVESMMRQADRRLEKHGALVVTHGLTIRCFVMRFFHMTVEEFEAMANPKNCDVVEIVAPGGIMPGAQFTRGRWAVRGLRYRSE